MITSDGIEVLDALPKGSSGHGGKRAGAGRKPPGYTPPPEKQSYDKAKARSEAAKADLAELEYKVKSGQYVDRATVVQVVATAYAAIAQTMRSIPDNLERKGIEPDTCAMVSAHIDDTLSDLADQFEMLSGGSSDEGVEDA